MHRRRILPVIGLAGLLLAASAPVTDARFTRPFTATSTRTLSPGITLRTGVARTSGGHRQSIRVVTIETTHPQAHVRSLISNGRVLGRERSSVTARKQSRPDAMVMAAVNGEASVRGVTDARAASNSMHVAAGELYVAQPCIRPVLGVDPDGTAHIDEVRAVVLAHLPGRDVPRAINRVNAVRVRGHTVLYTPRFGSSTRTRSGGIEVVLALDTLRMNATQEARVVRVRRGAGDTALQAGQAVLSTTNRKQGCIWQLRPGDTFTIDTLVDGDTRSPCGGDARPARGWAAISETQGGNAWTLRHRENAAWRSKGEYIYATHPKTGIGLTADGKVLMVTVDGRQGRYSYGISLTEMGQLMRQLGATDAINLDGGGSTVMTARLPSGALAVINRPSDGRERSAIQAFAALALPPGG